MKIIIINNESTKKDTKKYNNEVEVTSKIIDICSTYGIKVESIKDEDKEQYLKFLRWRNIESIEDICGSCKGSGVRTYGNTTTWRGGIGGQMLTSDVCDKCWGTGSKIKVGVDLKKLINLTKK